MSAAVGLLALLASSVTSAAHNGLARVPGAAAPYQSGLPVRAVREAAFRLARLSDLLERRGTDEMDRDLLYIDTKAGRSRELSTRFGWLSSAQLNLLGRAIRAAEARAARVRAGNH